MGIDVWPLWSAPNGTPDIITFNYSEAEEGLLADLIDADDPGDDSFLFIKKEDLLEIMEDYKDDKEAQTVMKHWLDSMEEKGIDFIRLHVNP